MSPKNTTNLCTLFWFAACLFYSIDTERFVYVSLSQTLVGGFFLLLANGVAIAHWLKTRSPWPMGFVQWLVLAWGIYMLGHAWISGAAECYKLTYLLVTLSPVLTLPYMLHNGLIGQKWLERGVLLMAVVQIVYLTAQAIGIGPDYNTFFRLTGCGENPNVAAMLLVITLPLCYDRFRSGHCRYFYAVVLIVGAVFLVILRCRTAFIGLIVIALVRVAFSARARAWWRRLARVRQVALCVGAVVSVVALANVLYLSKRDSSDGRLLVWKVSAMMVTERPMGCGIGLFEHDYNLRQGEYFASGEGSDGEKIVADTVFMAYNDYLEHAVEAGVIGLTFIIGFYIALIVKAYRTRNIGALAIITAVAVMSSVNFFYATIQPWFVFLTCGASVIDGKERNPVRIGALAKIITIVALGFTLYWQGSLLRSQLALARFVKADERREKVSLADVEALATSVSTSEAYWTFLHHQHLRRKDFDKALSASREAARYTSVPYVFYAQYTCLDKLGRAQEGIQCLQHVRHALPLNLTSRMMLLQHYERNGMDGEAEALANEIIQTPVKIQSKKASAIKQYATNYLKHKQLINNEED